LPPPWPLTIQPLTPGISIGCIKECRRRVPALTSGPWVSQCATRSLSAGIRPCQQLNPTTGSGPTWDARRGSPRPPLSPRLPSASLPPWGIPRGAVGRVLPPLLSGSYQSRGLPEMCIPPSGLTVPVGRVALPCGAGGPSDPRGAAGRMSLWCSTHTLFPGGSNRARPPCAPPRKVDT